MSSTITVTQYNKDSKTWTVTKDGQTFTVTDKNGDGKWDSKDTIKFNGDSGETLSPEDLYEAKYLSKGDEVTEDDMAKMSKFRELQEGRDKAAANQREKEIQAKLAKYEASKPKKKSFLDKVAPWVNLTAQIGSTVGMVGMMFNSFNNSGCNDCSVNNFTGMTAMLTGLSAINNSMLGFNASLPSAGYNTAGLFSGPTSLAGLNPLGISDVSTNNLTTAQAKLDAFIEADETNTKKTEEAEEKENEQCLSLVSKLETAFGEEVPNTDNYQVEFFVPKANKALITGVDGQAGLYAMKTEFNDEEKKRLVYINKYSYVPYTLLENGTITEKQAELINNRVVAYINHLRAGKKEACPTEWNAFKDSLGPNTTFDAIKTAAMNLQKAMNNAKDKATS